jgi:hypothetical protein
MKLRFAATAVAAFMLLGHSIAMAGLVLNPGTVINNTMGELGPAYNVNRLRDQSGLSIGYISGVTDFATYIGLGPTHTRSPDTNGWLSSGPNVLPGVIDFDLGAIFSVNQLAFWNHAAGSTANINAFRISTSNVFDFSASTLVGSFNNPEQSTSNPYPVQVYNLVDTNARYVRLHIDTYHGNGCCVAVGEMAFDVQAADAVVPEPATMLVWTLFGGLGACFLKCRKT